LDGSVRWTIKTLFQSLGRGERRREGGAHLNLTPTSTLWKG